MKPEAILPIIFNALNLVVIRPKLLLLARAFRMTSIPLRPRRKSEPPCPLNPLPHTIQTPSGLALLELQGEININLIQKEGHEQTAHGLPIGRLDFPDYRPDLQDPFSTAWMRRVHLYVGENQRLHGEVKKLPRAIAVIRRRGGAELGTGTEAAPEELEVVEVVRYKIIFSQRPEPVGTS